MGKKLRTPSKYETKDAGRKDGGFNIPVTLRTLAVIGKYSHRRFTFHVMDAKTMKTTKMLIENGILPSNIIAFTADPDDHKKMKHTNIVRTKKKWAEDLYGLSIFAYGCHIVIDDGMSTGNNTRPRIKTLLETFKEGPADGSVLAFSCNLSTRSPRVQHTKFQGTITAHARRLGLIVEHAETLDKYNQNVTGGGEMKPFWFVVRRG